MKITYISHSGFVVELEHHIFVFDYFRGDLPKLDAEKKIIVYASHAHHDHFVNAIFDWKLAYPNIQYVLSSDIRKSVKKELSERNLEECVTFMRANQKLEMDTVQIETLRSTDAGVAFLIKCEDRCIYHAGDLNWWHWEGEPEYFNSHMKEAYLKEMKKLSGVKIDAAFVPVDPRLGRQYYYGIDALAKNAEVRYFIPMHCWDDYSVFEKLMMQEETKQYRDRICKISQEGEVLWLKTFSS